MVAIISLRWPEGVDGKIEIIHAQDREKIVVVEYL
jgi:hypothetical protein